MNSVSRVWSIAALGAAGASLLLVFQHFSGAALPGCGPSSACAQLAAGRFGEVWGWPVSFLGLAYFVGLLAAFSAPVIAASGNRVPHAAQLSGIWIVRAGALLSVFFVGVMAAQQTWCPYCLLVHAANLLLAALYGWRRTLHRPSALGWWSRFGTVFTGTALILGFLAHRQSVLISATERASAEQSADEVIAALDDPPLADDVSSRGFTGRHARGPRQAAARLVVFHDYECGDCRELEIELREILHENPLVHISLRQFPLCADCNPEVYYAWFHANACRAARVAEAAYVVAGEEGFWTAHEWLFECEGKFSEEDLQELAKRLPSARQALADAIDSERVRRTIDADIQEGLSLGVGSTPFVFLNGIEIRGAASEPGNVRLALDRLMEERSRREQAGNPIPLQSAAVDRRPPAAADRVIAEWRRTEAVERLPDGSRCQHILGNRDGPKRVVLFLEPTFDDASGMWRMLTELAELRDDVRIEFYLYPISRELNPRFEDSKSALYPRSTVMSRLLKAAHQLAGDEAFNAAFAWSATTGCETDAAELPQALADHLRSVVPRVLSKPLTADALKQSMQSNGVAEAIASELAVAEAAEITWGPTLIIAGRLSPCDTVSAQTVSRMLEIPGDELP